jgi:homoserine kinase type II
MAILTLVTLEEARAIGALYGLEITSIRGIRAGSVNSNFEIAESNRRLFLRVYEEQTEETAGREASLLAHLAQSGVPTPEPLRRIDEHGFISLASGKPAAIFPFCDGEMVCQKGVTEEKAHSVGHALREIHDAGRALPAADLADLATASRFGRDALRMRLRKLRELESSVEIATTCAGLERFLEHPLPAPKVVGLIHGDVFRDNVLWQGERISAVLDFESASVGSIAFDLMVTVLAWCFGDDLDERLARALVRGYMANNRIDAGLVAELFDAGRFACARFTTTRLTDFELRPREATVYKDFRRWWRRMQCLTDLGSKGLLRALAIND